MRYQTTRFNPVAVYKALRTNALSVVKYHRSDWKHDRASLRTALVELSEGQTSTVSFVHVSTTAGTHMWYEEYHFLDRSRKYLFGRCTPRQTMRNLASIFAPESTSIPDNAVIQYFDGSTLKIIDSEEARRVFNTAANRPDTLPPNITHQYKEIV